MTEHEVLYMVCKRNAHKAIVQTWIFRTREAARAFKKSKIQRSKDVGVTYTLNRAAWGPEQ